MVTTPASPTPPDPRAAGPSERTRALAERAAAKRARRAQMEQARSSGLRLRRTEQLLRIAAERAAPSNTASDDD